MADRDTLIAARKSLGISARRMARALRTPRTTLQQWESGTRRTPGIAVVAAELLMLRAQRADQIIDLLDNPATIPQIAVETARASGERCGTAWR